MKLKITPTIKVVSLLLFLGSTMSCFSQQKNKVTDSIIVKKVDSMSVLFGTLISKDFDAAEEMALAMLKYSDTHEYLTGKGMAYGSLGGLYSYKGNGGKSIAYFIKSVAVFDSIQNDRLASITNSNIGQLLIDQQQYEEARTYVKKAHDYSVKNNAKLLPNTYISLGFIDLKTNKPFEQVIANLNKGEEYAILKNDTLLLSYALRVQGSAYIEHDKDIPLAISKLKQAIKWIKKFSPNNHHSLGISYVHLGRAYWRAEDYKKALLYNDSSLVQYETLDYFKGLRLAYESRKDILASQGNYKEAFEAFKQYSKHNDSTFQKQRENQIARIKIEYETDQAIAEKETAEAQVKLTEALSKQNRNYFIGALLIAFLILLAAIFYIKRLKTRKKMEVITVELKETQKRLALEKQYRDSELKALKAQMNPHFIFNALNSIQEYIILNKKDLAGDYLGKFADLMRKYLKHSDSGTLSIQDEIESLEMYLDLESLRFEDTLEYSFKVSETINKEGLHIPTMLIQPYIENALKHGLLHRKTGRKLWVSFSKINDTTIECHIEDNGVGRKRAAEIKAQSIPMHNSFATKATENRLDLLNYGKEQKIGVQIIDLYKGDGTAKGTKILLHIPTIKTNI